MICIDVCGADNIVETFVLEVLHGGLRRTEQEIRAVIRDDSIDLFGHLPIEAPQSGLDVGDGDVLGVSWSSTVYACAKNLKNTGVKDLTICQLNGSMDVADFSTRAEFIISKIAAVFKARTSSLAAPMLVDSPEILNSIMADTRIRNSFDIAQRATVGIFGIGSINQESSLYQTGYMSPRILDELRARKAVGDIAGHFFDARGEICDQLLESRTLAVPKSAFGTMRLSIALAGGAQKLEAIEGALAGKWCNVLVTDEITAQSLLRRRNAASGGAAR